MANKMLKETRMCVFVRGFFILFKFEEGKNDENCFHPTMLFYTLVPALIHTAKEQQ